MLARFGIASLVTPPTLFTHFLSAPTTRRPQAEKKASRPLLARRSSQRRLKSSRMTSAMRCPWRWRKPTPAMTRARIYLRSREKRRAAPRVANAGPKSRIREAPMVPSARVDVLLLTSMAQAKAHLRRKSRNAVKCLMRVRTPPFHVPWLCRTWLGRQATKRRSLIDCFCCQQTGLKLFINESLMAFG